MSNKLGLKKRLQQQGRLTDDPNDSWAVVELHRWQYGELPGPGDMRPLDESAGLIGMANALANPDQNKWPAPHNVESVLRYAAKRIQQLKARAK